MERVVMIFFCCRFGLVWFFFLPKRDLIGGKKIQGIASPESNVLFPCLIIS